MFFEKTLTATQIQALARQIVDDEDNRNTIIGKMRDSGFFRGEKGESGGVIGSAEVLAAIIVKDGAVVFSTSGVTFDRETGVVAFANPANKSFIPLLSDFNPSDQRAYMTSTHFLRTDFSAPNAFKVWTTVLDAGGRNSPPKSFVAIAVGF